MLESQRASVHQTHIEAGCIRATTEITLADSKPWKLATFSSGASR